MIDETNSKAIRKYSVAVLFTNVRRRCKDDYRQNVLKEDFKMKSHFEDNTVDSVPCA